MKRSVVVLSIFFTLSLSAMEKSAATLSADESPINITKKDPRAWEDFTLDKYITDETSTVEGQLSAYDLGRNYLIAHLTDRELCQDRLLSSLKKYKHFVVISCGTQKKYNFRRKGYDKIISGHILDVFCQIIARLEDFILTEGKDEETHIQRELESTRRRYLILLSQALKYDALYTQMDIQDLPAYFKKTRKEWPPKEDTNGVYSRLSARTVVRSALTKRIKNGIIDANSE